MIGFRITMQIPGKLYPLYKVIFKNWLFFLSVDEFSRTI